MCKIDFNVFYFNVLFGMLILSTLLSAVKIAHGSKVRNKYAIDEVERKWLMNRSKLPDLSALDYWEIDDKYIDSTQLRLRCMRSSEGGRQLLKLCKKYGRGEGYSEPITNIYLSQDEYNLLFNHHGKILKKRRYRYVSNEQIASIDIFIEPEHDYCIFEVEFTSVNIASQFSPPPFVNEEVTGNVDYFGVNLAAAPDRMQAER